MLCGVRASASKFTDVLPRFHCCSRPDACCAPPPHPACPCILCDQVPCGLSSDPVLHGAAILEADAALHDPGAPAQPHQPGNVQLPRPLVLTPHTHTHHGVVSLTRSPCITSPDCPALSAFVSLSPWCTDLCAVPAVPVQDDPDLGGQQHQGSGGGRELHGHGAQLRQRALRDEAVRARCAFLCGPLQRAPRVSS